MNFNTVEFLLFFLPAFLLIFHVSPAAWRLPALVLASLLFYGASGGLPLILLVLTIVWTDVCARTYFRSGNSRLVLLVGISIPLALLFLFKYLRFSLELFGMENLDHGFLTFFLAVALPAGISFYTFEVVSYLIDIRDGKITPERERWYFAGFVSFFPHLIAGPIMRYGQLREQLHRISVSPRVPADFRNGIKYLTVGLAYKIFFADVPRTFLDLGRMVGDFNSIDGLFSILSYTFIIYFDFWGYSLMAIGLGKLIGIELPRNFQEPYLSPSPREFWRRWHVTLSFWLRDYVYLKLGGNKRYILNILIVFAVVGLWHGAGVNFVVWGLYHGLAVAFYHLTRDYWDRMPRILAIAVTFSIVTLGWPLFYLDFRSYIHLLERVLSFENPVAMLVTAKHWIYLCLIALYAFAIREDRFLFSERAAHPVLGGVILATIAAASVAFLSYGRTFIYFQF